MWSGGCWQRALTVVSGSPVSLLWGEREREGNRVWDHVLKAKDTETVMTLDTHECKGHKGFVPKARVLLSSLK